MKQSKVMFKETSKEKFLALKLEITQGKYITKSVPGVDGRRNFSVSKSESSRSSYHACYLLNSELILRVSSRAGEACMQLAQKIKQ